MGVLLTVRILLSAIGYARTRKLAESLSASRAHHDLAVPASLTEENDVIAAAVRYAAVFCPGRMTCLEQSLTLYYQLRRVGSAPQLHLGVCPRPFYAHAWVSIDGDPINDDVERVNQLVPMSPCF